jgi:tetratricopeptide (TPR) repeat protein
MNALASDGSSEATKSPSEQPRTIEDRVIEIAQAQARLEAKVDKDENSFYKRLGAIGGLFALAISLITGAYTIYDRTVVRPNELVLQKRSELRDTANALVELQDKYIQEVTKVTDPVLREQAIRSINMRMELSLQRSRYLINELSDNIDFGELLIIGYFESSMGNLGSAKNLFELALRKDPASDITRAEIFLQLGQFYMLPGKEQNLSRGRDYYDKAYGLFTQRDDFNQLVVRVKWNIQRAASEYMASFSNKGIACEFLEKASVQLSALPPQFIPGQLTYLGDQINTHKVAAGC